MRMRRIIFPPVACPTLANFSLYLTSDSIFIRKHVIVHKRCVLIFCTTFVSTLPHSKNNSPRYNHTYTHVFMLSALQIFLADVNKTCILSADFRKRLKIKIWRCRYVKTQLNVIYLLCWRRHVSANVGHLQVMKMYMREKNYTVWDNLEVVHNLSCQRDLVNVRLTM
jgi:hypothetical protein